MRDLGAMDGDNVGMHLNCDVADPFTFIQVCRPLDCADNRFGKQIRARSKMGGMEE